MDEEKRSDLELNEDKTAETGESQPETPKKPVGRIILKEVREWVVSLAAALVIVLLLQSFVFSLIRVDGKSMYDTLDDNERLFTTVYDVRFGEIERGDVVICHYPQRRSKLLGFIPIQVDTNFVKRVVAVPGDQVYCVNGSTHVIYTDENGETVDEALDDGIGQLRYLSYDPITLGEDAYFVVGDNRYNSHDSRFWDDENLNRYDENGNPLQIYSVGPITKEMIVGHVRCVWWPLNKIRAVE